MIESFVAFDKFAKENKKAILGDVLRDTESIKIASLLIEDNIKKLKTLMEFREIKNLTVVNNLHLIANELKNIKESLEYSSFILDTKRSYTERISYIIMLVENLESTKKIFDQQSKAYKKFKTYILFFAQLSDTTGKNDAKLVLKTFALPQGNYTSKRNNEMHLSISSYVGFATGIETFNTHNFFYYGVTAPIGLEASWGTKQKNSFSVLGTVFDLGAMINSQIYNTSNSFDFDNVFSPGLTFIYGLPDMPLSIGLGHFKVNGLKNNTKNEHRTFLFIAVDMPLFSLY